jgi:hypothetical protein
MTHYTVIELCCNHFPSPMAAAVLEHILSICCAPERSLNSQGQAHGGFALMDTPYAHPAHSLHCCYCSLLAFLHLLLARSVITPHQELHHEGCEVAQGAGGRKVYLSSCYLLDYCRCCCCNCLPCHASVIDHHPPSHQAQYRQPQCH